MCHNEHLIETPCYYSNKCGYCYDCLTYNTLDDIEENLDIFKTISKGSISAITDGKPASKSPDILFTFVL